MVTTVPITVASVAGALLVSTLAVPYYKARNLPVLMAIFWLVLACTCITINTAGWQGNVDDKWRGFCELSIRITYSSAFALQCCSALLLSRLEAIAATRYVSLTDAAKRRRFLIELSAGIGLPALYILLAIINQGHRYDLLSDFGPVISIYPSALSVIFSTAPTLLASVAAVVYARSGVSVSQYARLFGLSCLELCWSVPIAWTISMSNLLNRYGGSVLYPYKSWGYVHQDYWHIGQYTLQELQQTTVGKRSIPIMYLGNISFAVTCFLFFGFLGTSTEISQELASRLRHALRMFRCSARDARPKSASTGGKKQPLSSDSFSQPSFSLNEEVKLRSDEFKTEDIQIEVLVERMHYEEPHSRA